MTEITTKRSVDGVLLRRIPSKLNPDHPYKHYFADEDGNPYWGSDTRGYHRIKDREKPCPPVIWELDGDQPPPAPKRKPILVVNVYQEGNRVTLEVQTAA